MSPPTAKGLALAREKILKAMTELHSLGRSTDNNTLQFVAQASGYSNAGTKTFRAAMKDLKEEGIVTRQNSLTEKGMETIFPANSNANAAAAAAVSSTATGGNNSEAMLTKVLGWILQDHEGLPSVEKTTAVFNHLLDGQVHAKRELAHVASYKGPDNKGFRNLIVRMKELGILKDVEPRGSVQLKESVLPKGGRISDDAVAAPLNIALSIPINRNTTAKKRRSSSVSLSSSSSSSTTKSTGKRKGPPADTTAEKVPTKVAVKNDLAGTSTGKKDGAATKGKKVKTLPVTGKKEEKGKKMKKKKQKLMTNDQTKTALNSPLSSHQTLLTTSTAGKLSFLSNLKPQKHELLATSHPAIASSNPTLATIAPKMVISKKKKIIRKPKPATRNVMSVVPISPAPPSRYEYSPTADSRIGIQLLILAAESAEAILSM